MPSRLRLLWVTPDLPLRGVTAAQERWRSLLARLAARHEIELLTFLDPETPEWHPTLLPADAPDRFTVEAGVRESGEPVVFHRRADGRVSSVTIGPFSLSRFDPVDG